MENVQTPLDEIRSANAREIVEHAQRNDEAGCFYRFMDLFDPNRLGEFIRAEADRGVPASDIMGAVSQGMAYHLVAISMMSTDEHRAYRDLVIGMQQHAIAMIGGGHRVGMVRVGADGAQREGTVEGRFHAADGRT